MSAGPRDAGQSLPRAILTVRYGPLDGRRALIEAGSTLRVGRTAPSGFVVPHDQHMSGVHCEIAWNGHSGVLRDRESACGTFLDGRRVTEDTVRHGAFIRAGDTVFVLQVEGAAPRDEIADSPETALRKTAALRELTSERAPLFALLDAARDPRILELLRVSAEEHASLYEGTKGQLLAEVAPYLVSLPRGSALLPALVREGWGESWGVYLASRRPLGEVRKQLRRILMVEAEGDPRKLYFRFYDPRVLRVFLPSCSLRQTEEMFSGVERFLMEGERGEPLRFEKGNPPLGKSA